MARPGALAIGTTFFIRQPDAIDDRLPRRGPGGTAPPAIPVKWKCSRSRASPAPCLPVEPSFWPVLHAMNTVPPCALAITGPRYLSRVCACVPPVACPAGSTACDNTAEPSTSPCSRADGPSDKDGNAALGRSRGPQSPDGQRPSPWRALGAHAGRRAAPVFPGAKHPPGPVFHQGPSFGCSLAVWHGTLVVGPRPSGRRFRIHSGCRNRGLLRVAPPCPADQYRSAGQIVFGLPLSLAHCPLGGWIGRWSCGVGPLVPQGALALNWSPPNGKAVRQFLELA